MTDPKWLTDVFDAIEAQGGDRDIVEGKKLAWRVAGETAQRNGEGLVVRGYNAFHDRDEWHFAGVAWPRLVNPGSGDYFPDDPFLESPKEIPLSDFVAYLHNWYFPQRRALDKPTQKADA